MESWDGTMGAKLRETRSQPGRGTFELCKSIADVSVITAYQTEKSRNLARLTLNMLLFLFS